MGVRHTDRVFSQDFDGFNPEIYQGHEHVDQSVTQIRSTVQSPRVKIAESYVHLNLVKHKDNSTERFIRS